MSPRGSADQPRPATDDEVAATCVDCGWGYPASFGDEVCIDCGGRLRRADGSLVEGRVGGADEPGDEWYLHFRHVAYMGGHPSWPDPLSSATLTIDFEGFSVWDSYGQSVFEVNISEIVGVEVDGPNEVQRRVTVPRVLALGLIALAVPKKEKLAYLVFTTDAGELIFEVRSMSAMQLRAAVQPLGESSLQPSDVAPELSTASRNRSARDRLIELNGLRDEGLVSEEEYDARRRSILNEI